MEACYGGTGLMEGPCAVARGERHQHTRRKGIRGTGKSGQV
jgi:hypothetical protein